MNSIFYFEIQANEVQRAMDFYAAVFGWQFSRQEGTPVPYWSIKTEGIGGGILQRIGELSAVEMGTNAFVCSVEVEEFDATVASILATGGRVAMPKFAIPGKCWQGYFLDTENNTFGIFQVDEAAA